MGKKWDTNLKKLSLGLIVVLTFVLLNPACVQKQEDVRIGVILPLTGEAAPYGESMRRGIDLAVEETNKAGGVRGRKLAVIYEDDQANPSVGVSAFRNLVAIYKVPAVIGGALSSVTLAIAPVAERDKVVFLSPASSAPAITHAGDYIFRNCTSDTFDGMVMAKYACEKLGVKKFSILYVNNDFGVGLRDSFKTEVLRLGGQVVDAEAFDLGATDFGSQLAKIKDLNPEAVFFVAYKEAGRILRQAGELGLRIRFLSVGIFEDPKVLELAGDAANGVYYTYRSYDPQSNDIRTAQFTKIFKSKYGTEPDLYAVYSYDAARIMAFALEKSDLTGPSIKDALYAIRNFPGVTGDITFDSNGDVLLPMGIKVVEHKSFKWVERNHFKP